MVKIKLFYILVKSMFNEDNNNYCNYILINKKEDNFY